MTILVGSTTSLQPQTDL